MGGRRRRTCTAPWSGMTKYTTLQLAVYLRSYVTGPVSQLQQSEAATVVNSQHEEAHSHCSYDKERGVEYSGKPWR